MLAGIREILLISSPRDLNRFRDLLGNGSQWGISIEYEVQAHPSGIADAFLIGEDFIKGSNVALALGDNIFHGSGLGRQLAEINFVKGAHIFGYEVANPGDYGVVTISSSGKVQSIEEKPSKPESNLAIPGFYFYDQGVTELTKGIKPSSRGELEISSINMEYLKLGQLKLTILPRGTAWLDTGTPETLHDAAMYVRLIEQRQGLKISCPEEIAWRNGWISTSELLCLANGYPQSSYSIYLRNLANTDQISF